MTRPTEASVVPIRLTVDERSGVTLWATPWVEDDEEWQAFLGSGRRVLVFPDAAALAGYLRSDPENDLTDHPRWSTLLALPPDQLEPGEGYEFDLDGVYDLAADEPDPFVVSELSDLLDIVQRIAECCDDGALLQLIEKTPEFAGLLDDEASFSGPDGEQRWTALGEALEQSWELVVDRLDGLLEWRDTDDGIRPAATGTGRGSSRTGADVDERPEVFDEASDLDEADLEDSDDAGGLDDLDEVEADTVWDEAGILPIALTLPSGSGYALRTYVHDEARFLGSDGYVEVFRSAAGLLEFIRAEDDHDLAGLETWPLVRDADALEVKPSDDDTYDLTVPNLVAVELALDIAEYCQLAGVDDALARAHSGQVPFDTWTAVVAEIDSCLRWRD